MQDLALTIIEYSPIFNFTLKTFFHSVSINSKKYDNRLSVVKDVG